MRDVVIIGGGLSGLAAANVLEAYQVPYTIIEVKPRFGGSIATEARNGFLVDTGPMLHQEALPDLLQTLQLDLPDLDDQTAHIRTDEDGDWMAFKRGTETLIHHLTQPLTGLKMMRMAVSTLGMFDLPHETPRFSICMENGMVMDARALIVAAPARHAERMFHTLKPEISYRLLDYRYDPLARLSVGYRRDDVPEIPLEPPPDYPITYLHSLTLPERVPERHVLIQAGIRYEPEKGLSPDVVGEFAALMGFPLNPVMEHVSIWTESEPLMWLDEDFEVTMDMIEHFLPAGIGLAGSDYIVTHDHRPTLQERIESGRQAAKKVLRWLGIESGRGD